MEKTKIGLIGCGEWGKYILRDLKTLGCHVTVYSLTERTTENAKAFFADEIIQQIDQFKQIDGFIVATPASTHAHVINQIVSFNVPIFVEKSFTTHPIDAKNLVDTLSDRLFVMHKWRYHAGIEALAHLVKTRELGSLIGLRTSRSNWGNHHTDVDMIWTCLPHDLSIAMAILGYIPKPRYAVATEWGNETTELIACLGEKPWHIIEVSSIRPIINREIYVECEEGFALLKDGYTDHIEIYHRKHWGLDPKKHVVIRPFKLEMPLLRELQDFVHYLKGGPKPRCDAKEGLAVVETIAQLRDLANIKHSGVLTAQGDALPC